MTKRHLIKTLKCSESLSVIKSELIGDSPSEQRSGKSWTGPKWLPPPRWPRWPELKRKWATVKQWADHTKERKLVEMYSYTKWAPKLPFFSCWHREVRPRPRTGCSTSSPIQGVFWLQPAYETLRTAYREKKTWMTARVLKYSWNTGFISGGK